MRRRRIGEGEERKMTETVNTSLEEKKKVTVLDMRRCEEGKTTGTRPEDSGCHSEQRHKHNE